MHQTPDSLANQGSGERAGFGGYNAWQGSPQHGDTASPPSSCFQNPSLPDSGLTEQNSRGTVIAEVVPIYTGSAMCNRTSNKRYVGVRVKMPVKEMLKKMRTANGTDPSDTQESALKGTSNKCRGKGRVHPFSDRRQKQAKYKEECRVKKGVDELELLVEILKKDLETATAALIVPWKTESRDVPTQNCTRGYQCYSYTGDQALSPAQSEGMYLSDCETEMSVAQHSKVRGQCSCDTHKDFPHYYHDDSSSPPLSVHHRCPSAPIFEACYDPVQSCPGPAISQTHSTGQDPPAFSIFHFQLQQEDHRLMPLPPEALVAIDENGNGLLHNAVISGKRALVYTLASRLAAFKKIDIKDATNKTALHLAAERNQHLIVRDLISFGANANEREHSGKTPLHLCAENGHLRVLEAFRQCMDEGLELQVEAVDHKGES